MLKPVICPICHTQMKPITINKYGNILYAIHSDDNISCTHGTDFIYESAEAAIQAWNIKAVGLGATGIAV